MKATKDLHTEEFKVRLKEQDAAMIELLAQRLDIKPAALLRTMIIRHLSSLHDAEFNQFRTIA